MSSFKCSCGVELVHVDEENGRGVYECPECPLIEWRECLNCHEVNICFPSRSMLCQQCKEAGVFVVQHVSGQGPIIHANVEACLEERILPATWAFESVLKIRARARRRLGLSDNARVPKKIENVCAAALRGTGWTFEGGRWWLPNSVALL